MKFRMVHMNINTIHLAESLTFYKTAFDMEEVRRKEKEGEFTLVYLTDSAHGFQLEITWLADRTEPYDVSDNEIHLAFVVDDYEAALAKHKEMGIVAFENKAMGIYFVEDPDGYWVEVIPEKR